MTQVECEHCFRSFEVADSLAGGIASCPACGKATPVSGQNDPWFWVVKIGMAVVWAMVTAVGYSAGGVTGAVIAGGITALLLGVVYISM